MPRNIKKSHVKKREQTYVIILQIILISIVSSIIYMMFMPTLMASLFELEEVNLVFPAISSVLDYYGLAAFLLFFAIHLMIIRMFIHDNKIFTIGFVAVIISLALYILISDILYSFIAFFYGETTSVWTGELYPTHWESGMVIAFINLTSMVVFYNIMFMFLVILLINREEK